MKCAALLGSVLATEPKHAIAAHLLGLALKEAGDLIQGEQWMRFSIRLEPERAEFHANLGNLLRRQSKYHRAERVYRRALNLAPNHRPTRLSLALTLHDLGRFGDAEAESKTLIAANPADAEAWIALAMALEGQARWTEAEAAYQQAIRREPDNEIAHHNLGALLSRMDLPDRALQALAQARRLGAADFEVSFNRGRALLDLNDLDAAEREFEQAVALRPDNLDAQAHLARIRFMRGDPLFARSVADASAARRDDHELQLLFGQLLWKSGQLVAAESLLRDVLARGGDNPRAQSLLAGVLLDENMLRDAERFALAAATLAPDDSDIVETLVTILLSRGCPLDAQPFIDAQLGRSPGSQAWLAYHATAARMTGHPAHPWLYDYDRFVRAYDVEAPPGWSSMRELNEALVATLTDRHQFTRHPLDQTLRNGTQTSRSLLADPDPAVKAILDAFREPIADYRASLGCDERHPLLSRNRGPAGFTGAWSVRLRRQGFHVNHFHPDGWLSSAYYVDVPAEVEDRVAKSGWIKFGEPRYPVPGLAAERFVQPRAGRLVLFPSYMWHGTNAIIGDAQRVTIAFDVKAG